MCLGPPLVEEELSDLISQLKYNVIYRFRRHRGPSTRTWYIFQQPTDILMLSLFFGDLLQAIGSVMDLKWVGSGHLEVGQFCSAQGILKQLGEVGVALSTLAIALYTFIGIWRGRTIESNRVTVAIIGIIWFSIGLLTLLGYVLNNRPGEGFERPTPYWCWIGEPFFMWRLFGEYLWLWITLLVSIVAYFRLFLWSRGNIIFDDVFRRNSLIMLLYPSIYGLITLPLSVVRWTGFVQEQRGLVNTVPSAATFAVMAIFSLSGACNTILLLTTRPDAGLFSKFNYDDMDFAPATVPLQPRGILAADSTVEVQENDHGRLPSR
ncbi:hypothetical protein K443DRAFT_102086 [Laccaria amethystina LaAM-08-1]|uniref:Glucose receptor Git3 N-terminal domain-containing protein n=1 Tax=Laccaria amethystina LaAM-08-1 TaxID=1095629 RepID=A0A0C9XPL1_9AGAR|nr:hypothetical protein K443DRAFT_102086 [Laccaria amethystina LaAM-08-1]